MNKLKKDVIYINPGKIKAEFSEEIGGPCFSRCPIIDTEEETLNDRIENFISVLEEVIVGKKLTKVCSYIQYYNFDNISAYWLNELDRRVIPFRIENNIILVIGDNILSIDTALEYVSLELNRDGLGVIESENIRPIELYNTYEYKKVPLDISWGFKDLLDKTVTDVRISDCCGEINGIRILLDNDFEFIIPLFSDESIDCSKIQNE